MTSILSAVVIGLLRLKNKQFDHKIKIHFSLFDETYFTSHYL